MGLSVVCVTVCVCGGGGCHRMLEFMLNVSHHFHFNEYLIERYVNQC